MTGKFQAFVLGVIPAVIVVISLVVALSFVQFLIGNFLDPLRDGQFARPESVRDSRDGAVEVCRP